MPLTITHARHVFDLLVISQVLDYRLQFFKSVNTIIKLTSLSAANAKRSSYMTAAAAALAVVRQVLPEVNTATDTKQSTQ